MVVIFLFLLGGCIFIDPNETSSVKGTWTGTARLVAVYDKEGNHYEAISLDDATGPILPDRTTLTEAGREHIKITGPLDPLLVNKQIILQLPFIQDGEFISVRGLRWGGGSSVIAPDWKPGHVTVLARRPPPPPDRHPEIFIEVERIIKIDDMGQEQVVWEERD